jgi:hypothetical protein
MKQRPDRSFIKLEWIERVVGKPVNETVQHDGRIRCWYYFMPLAALLSCAWLVCGQAIRATVVYAPIEGTSASQWQRELRYKKTELYPLALTTLGCPLIEVDVGGTKIRLMLDTGTSRGFLLTNHAPDSQYRLEGRHEELNADGSHRGESASIRVEAMTVLGKVFKSVGGSLSEWTMFSSEPFDGTVGLDFFLDRRVTLDYRSRTVGTTAAPLPEKLDSKRYITVDLIDPPTSQGHILYGRARVNGREAIIYFDTGYNVSFIDPEFSEGLAFVERPGKFKIYRKAVPVELGGRIFEVDELREDQIRRGAGFDHPIAVTFGSDILSRFVITVDLRARKMILALSD